MVNMYSINELFMSGVESAAQMSFGQSILKVIDRIMYVIENSIQWSLPAPEDVTEENGQSFGKIELVRPLPWILFLPTLLMLRMIRFSINVSAFVLGYPQVQPSDMMRMLQRARRRIRNIKCNGMKNMRLKKISEIKDRPMTLKEASKSLAKSIRLTLSTLSCLDAASKSSPSPPPTKIRISNILGTSTPITDGHTANEHKSGSPKTEVKRKYSELSDDTSEAESDDEPLISKIDRLANESDSDKDYSPNESTTSDLSDSFDSEADANISMGEIRDLEELKDDLEKGLPTVPETKEEKADNELHNSNLSDGAILIKKKPETSNGLEELNTMNNDNEVEEIFSANGIAVNYQINSDGQAGELDNGEVKNEENDNHGSHKLLDETNEAVANGHMKEKPKIFNSGGTNKQHYQKNKKGSHGNRKKK